MKKVLFIISNLQTGGVSKSLTSLMNVIDRERYDVSLMVVSPIGPFFELLPKDLYIITNPIWSDIVGRFRGTVHLLKTGHPLLAVGTLLRFVLSKISKSHAGILMAKMMPALDEEFDTIVDFNGQQQCYYMVDKLKAKKKVTFFHSDYAKWPYYYKADKHYFEKVDYIFTISEECVLSLKKYFPRLQSKLVLMHNISPVDLIEKLAMEHCPPYKEKSSLITVGHVIKPKGFDLAISAATLLKKRNIKFHWYFLGAIPDPSYANYLINKYEVEDRVTLLGIKVNPYPYIRQADVVIHPARYEGKSVALDEAKLLCKPVVVTNFSTVGDQFKDGYNASICEMHPESIANAIEELLNNDDLRKRYMNNLLLERHDNSTEIETLYKVFDE